MLTELIYIFKNLMWYFIVGGEEDVYLTTCSAQGLFQAETLLCLEMTSSCAGGLQVVPGIQIEADGMYVRQVPF